jgi:hypothetical protein
MIVQRILGHSKLDQTFDYTEVLDEARSAAAEKMAILFEEAF